MAHGLYKPSEIAVMTDDALDELLGYYGDTGNTEGVRLVRDEQADREAERRQDQEDEAAYEAEQERQQRLHDEMIDDMVARGDGYTTYYEPDDFEVYNQNEADDYRYEH